MLEAYKIDEGTWVWLTDHDLDLSGEGGITVYSGRGSLSESQGPVWMIGTGECSINLDVEAHSLVLVIASVYYLLLSIELCLTASIAEHHVIYQYPINTISSALQTITWGSSKQNLYVDSAEIPSNSQRFLKIP
jgi:hypothetical protein